VGPNVIAVRALGRLRLLGIFAALLVLWGALAAGASARGLARLDVGFGDPLFASSDTATRELWLTNADATGSSLVRINVSWRAVAPKAQPAGFEAANPSSPGYEWANVDAAVRSAAAHGLSIMLTVMGAPAWAEGPGRPAEIKPGAWEPDPAAYGAFAHALATRYSGSFPDPLVPGTTLPRVRHFEVWNEPNLDTYLAPQWQGNRAVGVSMYRELLNRFYSAVKAVQSDAVVIAGSLAPFGDPPGGHRTMPVSFLRELLCLRGDQLKPVKCPQPARFDVLSDHPIAVGPPSESALSPLNVTTPNLDRLTRVLRKAEETGGALPRRHKQLWVTEFWYDSNPPDPNGVPLWRQARWYEQDLYMFWRQGARAAITLQIRDSPPGKLGFPYTNQSGAFFVDGSPKPSQTAFRFPFVAQRTGRNRVLAWGIAPQAGLVRIEKLRHGKWTRIGTVRAQGSSHPFQTQLTLTGHAQLRAQLGTTASLAWRQG
jgi:hypothetical protein